MSAPKWLRDLEIHRRDIRRLIRLGRCGQTQSDDEQPRKYPNPHE